MSNVPARARRHAPVRQQMPRSRIGVTTSFQIGDTELYVTANANADGTIGEVFAKFGKEGSTTAGLMDMLSIAISLGLQHGVPLEAFIAKYRDMRFEPLGRTVDPDIPQVASVGDYLARRLGKDWLDHDSRTMLDIPAPQSETALPSRSDTMGAASAGSALRQ